MKKLFSSVIIIFLCVLCFYGAYKIDSRSKVCVAVKKTETIAYNLNYNTHHKFKELSEGNDEKKSDVAIAKPEVKEDSKTPTNEKEAGKNNTPVQKPQEPATQDAPAAPTKNPLIDDNPNIIIRDCISDKIILAKRINLAGTNVADATLEVLHSLNIEVTYSSGYFSMIAGLKEKKSGPNSGWLYYVDGKAPFNIGSSGYNLNGNEKIEWKYLKDAVNTEN